MRVGRGENRQTHVYVHNLSDFYVLLVEQAAAGRGKATWEKEGCYFVHCGEQVVANWSRSGTSLAGSAYLRGIMISATP